MERMVCLLLGYACGNFLTGELVARVSTGGSARALGTGNPGMANIAGSLGIGWGALVLLGDVGKTALACLLCRLVLFPQLGPLAALYAGLGAALGHNYPVWKRFRGGKGVAVTCAFLVFVSPLWGLMSNLVGLAAVALTGYLPLGAVLIPLSFLLPAFLRLGPEAGLLTAAALALMLARHYRGLLRIARGQEEKKLRRRSAE